MAIYENGMAPITQSVTNDETNIQQSYFDESYIHTMNGIIGAEMPIDLVKIIPNTKYDGKYLMSIRTRNPLAREMRTGLKVNVHAYYMKNEWLWKGWKNYITKGRSGSIKLEVPKLFPDFKDGSVVKTTLTPCSPADYMGVPIRAHDITSGKDNNYQFKAVDLDTTANRVIDNEQFCKNDGKTKWGLNALPFAMYNRIHRDYYMNQNLMQNNKWWFPDDDTEFIIPYNPQTMTPSGWYGSAGGTHNYINRLGTTWLDDSYTDTDDLYRCDPVTNNDKCYLNKLHFRQFRGDYFTTSNPFADLLRGNATDIANAIGSIQEFDFSQQGAQLFTHYADGSRTIAGANSNDTGAVGLFNNTAWDPVVDVPSLNRTAKKIFNNAIRSSTGLLNKMRKAVVLEKFMMRNGATNGTYSEIIKAQFGVDPQTVDGKPIYLGGGTFDINFNSITMTSSDTATQDTGDKVSDGMGTGIIDIGSHFFTDSGWVMVIATIVPDVYYNNQRLSRMWTDTTQDKEYYPIMNNLEPQPILNKELFISGNDTTDNNIFGYAERFEHMRSRQNLISGMASIKNNVFDSCQYMKRVFNTPPTLSNDFVTMYPDNIDMTPFKYQKEIPFDIMVGCNVGLSMPLPYESKPADMGIAY